MAWLTKQMIWQHINMHAKNKACVVLDSNCRNQLQLVMSVLYNRNYSSSQPIDMVKIMKSNIENKAIDGVKKSTPKSKIKKVPKTKTVVETPVDIDKTDISELKFPEFFNVVLESSLHPDVEMDQNKFEEFKDFVETLDVQALPSVSTIIKKTEPKAQAAVLKRWKDKMTKELGGEEQFQVYRQDILDKGLNLHKCIELYLSGDTEFKVTEKNECHWESVQHVLTGVTEVKVMEEECIHPEMFYRGKFDCIALYKDTLCLIEWKTSSKHKPLLSNTYDNPLQVAAYIGAVNRSGLLKNYGISSITNGAIVIAYKDGSPATIHMMKQKVCEKYWAKWSDRVYQYWALQYTEKQDVV